MSEDISNPAPTAKQLTSTTTLSRGLIAAMAFATGAVVANLYYIQPLAQTLSREFHASSSAVGMVITLLPIGYAIGLATLVPLGDLLERRRLLATMLSGCVIGLVVMALAPSLLVLGVAAAVVGLTSVATHVIVPLAAQLAAKQRQGRVISTVMSGLLLGILLSRAVSGLVSSVAGWRAVFGLAALVTAGVTFLLWRQLPRIAATVRMSYAALLTSVLHLIRDEPVLRIRIFYGAMMFASFSAFWTSVGFLLGRPPYEWNDAQIGAFALLGAMGAVAVKSGGWLADRGLALMTTGAFLCIMVFSYVLLEFGATSAVALGAGAILMDLGCQGTHICNQTLIFPLRPEARSRLNTAYMTSGFIAASVGSALSAIIYPVYGWTGVCVLGAVFPTVAALAWLIETVRKFRSRVSYRSSPGSEIQSVNAT